MLGTVAEAEAASFQFTTIDVPGADSTYANGINDAGDIVGDFNDGSGTPHGYLKQGSSFTTIDVPGAVSNYASANGINNADDIVGSFSDTHGYLKQGSSFTTIDVPGASYTYANGINDAGNIVGSYLPGLTFRCASQGSAQSFLIQGSSFINIDVPGANCTYANGINNAGDVVGSFRGNPYSPIDGYLEQGGSFTTIDDPRGVYYTSAEGINNAGDIVGYFYDGSGTLHGFLATPITIPEPPMTSGAVVALLGGYLLLHKRKLTLFCRQRR